MSQADNACTTRRALFGAGLAVAALAMPAAAMAAPTCAKKMTPEQLALIIWAESCCGDLGLQAAHHAIRAGFDVNDASGIGKAGTKSGEVRRVVIYFDEGERTYYVGNDGPRESF